MFPQPHYLCDTDPSNFADNRAARRESDAALIYNFPAPPQTPAPKIEKNSFVFPALFLIVFQRPFVPQKFDLQKKIWPTEFFVLTLIPKFSFLFLFLIVSFCVFFLSVALLAKSRVIAAHVKKRRALRLCARQPTFRRVRDVIVVRKTSTHDASRGQVALPLRSADCRSPVPCAAPREDDSGSGPGLQWMELQGAGRRLRDGTRSEAATAAAPPPAVRDGCIMLHLLLQCGKGAPPPVRGGCNILHLLLQ